MLTIYEEIKDSIPKDIKQNLEEKFPNIEERINFLLNFDSNDEGAIEFFSSKYSDDLENPSLPSYKKSEILTGRIGYLKGLGIAINYLDYEKYTEIIKREEVKKLIPSEDLIDKIIDDKIEVKRRAQRICIYRNEYFIKSVDNIAKRALPTSNTPGFLYESIRSSAEDALYHQIKRGNSCCLPLKLEINLKSKQIPIMFLLITRNESAQLDYVFLHELIHAIEFNKCLLNENWGFDICNKIYVNSYNQDFRMYERLNETITDMIAEKIRKKLFKKGIYLDENKKMTDTKIMKNRNTDNILKIMLYPLFDKVEQELLDAKLTGSTENFVTLIGLENFQDLNDAINKVDYLIQKENLKEKLENKNYEDPTILEYYNQLARVKTIYEDIDNHLLEQNKTDHKEFKKAL